MKPSCGVTANSQAFTGLLILASAISALSSFLLFGLQPLAVAEMSHWHTLATVVHFFQWTYLTGVALTALSSGLAPGPDLRLAAAVFVPAACYTIIMVMPEGPHRLGHLAHIAVWLACSSTVMSRALGKTPTIHRLRPYTILASSNAGALLGVVVWLHPAHVASDASWMTVIAILLVLGASLAMVAQKEDLPEPLPGFAGEVCPVSKARVPVVAPWFTLAMSASLAMMLAQSLFTAIGRSSPGLTAMHAAGTALPLMVFLLAYVVGWSQAASAAASGKGHWYQHGIATSLIAAWALAFDPAKAAVSVALYVFCAVCVTLLRRFAPPPAKATLFQVVQAAGGVFGGWLALLAQ